MSVKDLLDPLEEEMMNDETGGIRKLLSSLFTEPGFYLFVCDREKR